MDRKIERIKSTFPGLSQDDMFHLTSPSTRDYNCLAWAIGRKDFWMWPNTDGHIKEPDEYWPENVPNDERPDTLVKAYETFGFKVSENANQEEAYEKIALYKSPDGSTFTHAARQLPDGTWTSKLSYWEDIQHGTPQSLEGEIYGQVYCYMKRKKIE